MGNLCGKQSKDGFDGPGRTLGSAPAPAIKASVPAGANAKVSAGSSQKRIVGGPARTLGEANAGGDPGRNAGDAAEARANKVSTGALQKRLDAQKKETREQTLKSNAAENIYQRDLDRAMRDRRNS